METDFQNHEQKDLLDDVMLPAVYSKVAIRSFSFFFTPVFGGILLMQNLRDIKKDREANQVLILSIALTIGLIFLMVFFNIQSRIFSLAYNFGAAALFTELFFTKHFPNEALYPKKKVWKPLIIGIAVCIALVVLSVWAASLDNPDRNVGY